MLDIVDSIKSALERFAGQYGKSPWSAWRPMQNNSAAEQPVYDPFLGSGTTLIAAETIGEARFVDVAVRRWEAFTGKEAKRS